MHICNNPKRVCRLKPTHSLARDKEKQSSRRANINRIESTKPKAQMLLNEEVESKDGYGRGEGDTQRQRKDHL